MRILAGICRLSLVCGSSALSTPLIAHSVIEFDHAVPAVGSVIDSRVTTIELYFRTEYDTRDVSILVKNGRGAIPFHIIPAANTAVIVAKTKSALKAGRYYVSWKISDDHHDDDDEFWHQYSFTVSRGIK